MLPFNHRSNPWTIATHSICTIICLSSAYFSTSVFFDTNKGKMFLSITCPVGQPWICRESKNVSCITGRQFWKVAKRRYTANIFYLKIGVCLLQKLWYNILMYPSLFSSLWTPLGKLLYHSGFWIMSFVHFLLHYLKGLLKCDQVLQKGLLLQLLLFTLFCDSFQCNSIDLDGLGTRFLVPNNAILLQFLFFKMHKFFWSL